jgi:hypothetical protein
MDKMQRMAGALLSRTGKTLNFTVTECVQKPPKYADFDEQRLSYGNGTQ